MTLNQVKKGQIIEILDVDDNDNCRSVLKMGLSKGHRYSIEQVYRHGPVVLSKGYTHIAVGYSIAKGIKVEVVS